MKNIITINNVINKDEISFILNKIVDIDIWDSGGGILWNEKSLSLSTLYNKYKSNELVHLLLDIKKRIQGEIIKNYNLTTNIYPDLLQLARWFPEQELPQHTDGSYEEEGQEFYNHRDFAALIYLNDDFGGGQTFYSNDNVTIKPTPGTLLIHKSDVLHGILKVRNKVRYTINSFWTFNETHNNKWIAKNEGNFNNV